MEQVTFDDTDLSGTPSKPHGALGRFCRRKRIFLFDDLPVRSTELAATDGLTLAANGPVESLNLIGDGDRFLTTFGQSDALGARLVIPDTAAPMTPGVRMFGGVRNESFEEDATVSLRLYSADGTLQKEVEETIAAGAGFSIKPGYNPFSPAESGWIEIREPGTAYERFPYARGPGWKRVCTSGGRREKGRAHIPDRATGHPLTLITRTIRKTTRLHPALPVGHRLESHIRCAP